MFTSESAFTALAADADSYTSIPISTDTNLTTTALKWRYDEPKGEIEFVVDMSRGSWLALGLRGRDASAKCVELARARDAQSVEVDGGLNAISSGLQIRKLVSNYLTTTTPSNSGRPRRVNSHTDESCCSRVWT